MKDKYQSEILQVIHEDMKGLHKLGIISDAEMGEFDEDCLVQKPKATVTPPVQTGRIRISAKDAGTV